MIDLWESSDSEERSSEEVWGQKELVQVAGGTIPVAWSHLYIELWINPDTAKSCLDYERLYGWDGIAIFIITNIADSDDGLRHLLL